MSVFPSGSVVKNPPASAGDSGSVLGLGRFPGEGNGSPLQYSCLEDPVDRGASMSFSSWGCRELDRAELALTHMSSRALRYAGLRAVLCIWWLSCALPGYCPVKASSIPLPGTTKNICMHFHIAPYKAVLPALGTTLISSKSYI